MSALFKLGQTVITRNALAFFSENELQPLTLLAKHQSGDWGDICDEDIKANVDAIAFDGRILSSYVLHNQKIYVITEWSREYTTVMLAEDY